jgi:hypothetical protein
MFKTAKKYKLKEFEIPKNIYISNINFTRENKLLSKSLKLNRFNIYKHFQNEIENMFLDKIEVDDKYDVLFIINNVLNIYIKDFEPNKNKTLTQLGVTSLQATTIKFKCFKY